MPFCPYTGQAFVGLYIGKYDSELSIFKKSKYSKALGLYSYQNNCKLQVYYMSTKTKLNLIYCNHMFHSHSILNPFLPSPLKLQNFTTPN